MEIVNGMKMGKWENLENPTKYGSYPPPGFESETSSILATELPRWERLIVKSTRNQHALPMLYISG